METILLTGGTGFIGSHTSVELLSVGENVILSQTTCQIAANKS